MSSICAYESNAEEFLRIRDTSKIGIDVVGRWARKLGPSAEVIEIACGGGFPVSRTLDEAKLKVWAIDSSPTLIDTFRTRFPHVPVRCESALTSTYFEKEYDAAISVGLLFLLPEEDQIALLGRVAAHLRPGANFLFTAPQESGEWADSVTGHKCLSLGSEAYKNALEESGFKLLRTHLDRGENNYYEAERIGNSQGAGAA